MKVVVQMPDGTETTMESVEQMAGLMASQGMGTFIVHATDTGFLIVLGSGPGPGPQVPPGLGVGKA